MNFEVLILPAAILLGTLVGSVPMSLHNHGRLSLGRHTPHKIMVLQVIFATMIFFASIFINEAIDPPRWNISESTWTPVQVRKHWVELAVTALWVCFPVTYIASYITGLRGDTADTASKSYAIIWPLLGILCLIGWMIGHFLYGCAIHDSCP